MKDTNIEVAVMKEQMKQNKVDHVEIKELINDKHDVVIDRVESLNTVLSARDRTDGKRLSAVEDNQQKFSWYVGIAMGVGAVIMFAVDYFWKVIKGA